MLTGIGERDPFASGLPYGPGDLRRRIQRFFAAGFRILGGHADLTMDLAERRHRWLDGVHLHGRDFRC